jgi:hypothetical protein
VPHLTELADDLPPAEAPAVSGGFAISDVVPLATLEQRYLAWARARPGFDAARWQPPGGESAYLVSEIAGPGSRLRRLCAGRSAKARAMRAGMALVVAGVRAYFCNCGFSV